MRVLLFHKIPFLIAGAPVDCRRYKKAVENNLVIVSCIIIFNKCYKYLYCTLMFFLTVSKWFFDLLLTVRSECFTKV